MLTAIIPVFACIGVMAEESIIDKIEINGVTAPEAGGAPSTSSITVPDGAKYTVTAGWTVYDYDSKTFENFDGNFESQNIYRLDITAHPASGYLFDEYAADVFVNGEDAWGIFDLEIYAHAYSYGIYGYYSVGCTEIESVNVLGIGEPEVGDNSSDFTPYVPEGANYTIEYSWYDDSWNNFSGTFDSGHYYYLTATICPKKAFCFSPYVTSESESVYYQSCIAVECYKTFEFEADIFGVAIDEVIISYTEPSVGTNMSDFVFSIPDGANYLVSAEWYSENYELVSGKIEDGKLYYVDFTITAKEGYKFNENTTIKANDNEDFVYEDCLQTTTSIVLAYYPPVEKVEVSISAYVSDNTEEAMITVEGNHNVLMAMWSKGDNVDDLELFEGVFDENTQYWATIILAPEDGCKFDENTEITVNGKKLTADDYVVTSTGIILMVPCTAKKDTRTEIKKLNITMPVPSIGDNSEDVVFSLPDGANCTIDFSLWGESDEADSNDITATTGEFKEDKYYYVVLSLAVNEGYKFTDNTVITINGRSGFIPEGFSKEDMFTKTSYSISFNLGKLSEKKAEQTTPEDTTTPEDSTSKPSDTTPIPNPDTGDGFSFGLVAIIMTASVIAASMTIVVSKKRTHG